MMKRVHSVLCCLVLIVFVVSQLPTSVWSAEPFTASKHQVKMSDGVPLATDVFLPEKGKDHYPVILVRTPYSKALGPALATNMSKLGYAVVIQDIRGRFESGKLNPEGDDAIVFFNEGYGGEHQDGHDTLDWIVKQEWCNGKICTWGGSAVGITQTMMAPGARPELKAQYVQVAFSDMYSQGAYQGGVWRKSLMDGWLKSSAFAPRTRKELRAHPLYGDFWKPVNADAQADQVHAAGLYWGGWYDIFAQGTLNSFTHIQNQGGEGAKGNCRLVMGPWAHGGFKELKYPANSKNPEKGHDLVRFYAHFVNGEQNGVGEEKPVQYYVMGDTTDLDAPGNFWRAADNWPPPAQVTPYYFHSGNKLKAGTTPEGNSSLNYIYDPKNPVPTLGGQNLMLPKGPMDQTSVENREDVLLFSTEVLKEPVEVTGRIYAKLYVSSDCPDTDFTVKLCDVYPDGRSMLVTDGILRARYRNSFETAEMMKPGETYELTVDLWSTSLVFNKGHRIRVAVSSSNAPRFEQNSNTGKALYDEGDPVRTARNTLHLSKDHPSHILLPIYAGE